MARGDQPFRFVDADHPDGISTLQPFAGFFDGLKKAQSFFQKLVNLVNDDLRIRIRIEIVSLFLQFPPESS